ncbi:MAG: hypothetical protein J6C37_06120 [Roseburia sp.]|nr:hypothetical protein [Roseburia sp.]
MLIKADMAGMPFAVPINRIMLPGVPIYRENTAGEDAPSRRREVMDDGFAVGERRCS